MSNLSENVLFVRSEEADNNDPWDDTILIQAYNAAIGQCSEAIEHSENIETTSISTSSPPKKGWKRWDHCRAVYSGDGRTYEALVVSTQGDKCVVKFRGYGNKECVALSSLTKSKGGLAVRAQIQSSKRDRDNTRDDLSDSGESSGMRSHRSSVSSGSHPPCHTDRIMPPPPAPPPPPLFSRNGEPPSSNDAFHAMLMSWYMSGYHTGYYECLKRNNSNN